MIWWLDVCIEKTTKVISWTWIWNLELKKEMEAYAYKESFDSIAKSGNSEQNSSKWNDNWSIYLI